MLVLVTVVLGGYMSKLMPNKVMQGASRFGGIYALVYMLIQLLRMTILQNEAQCQLAAWIRVHHLYMMYHGIQNKIFAFAIVWK